jgi:ketosteroid isomerase-like protein
MSQENVERVRRAFDAWNAGDFDGWVERMHPDFEWSPAIPQTMEGAEAVYRGGSGLRRYWDEMHSVWDFTGEVAEVRDLGDTVMILGCVKATGRVSGVDVDSPWAMVVELKDGLGIRARTYRSHHEALEAVGLSEQDARADS